MQQRSLQQVRVSVSLIFLIHGLIIATWASRIPAFQAHLHLSPAVLGRSLMMAAIGSVPRDWVDIGVWPRTALDCRTSHRPIEKKSDRQC